MRIIKFSHDYEKLPHDWKGTQAVLVGVHRETVKRIRLAWTAFYTYDTMFRGENGQYVLNFDDAIILCFIHLNSGKPFTTIRRYTTDKMRYYLSMMGITFELQFSGGEGGQK